MATDATGTPTTNYSIPKFNTAVDSPTGKGSNAQMDAIDTLLLTRTEPAATAIFQNLLVAGDANPSFKLTGDGKFQWGAGGASALDVNLYRAGVDRLSTDDVLELNYNTSYALRLTGASGGITFGGDTNLYRNSAGMLQMDTTELRANAGSAGQGVFSAKVAGDAQARRWYVRGDGNMYWGDGTNPTDVALGRGGAQTLLVTEATFEVLRNASTSSGLATLVSGDTNARFTARADGMLLFGPGNVAADTNLYRSAANVLKTDDDFNVGGRTVITSGGVGGDIIFQSDTNLYRSAANMLKTDDAFTVGGGQLYIGTGQNIIDVSGVGVRQQGGDRSYFYLGGGVIHNTIATGFGIVIQNSAGDTGATTGGGALYAVAGALKWKGSSGTVTTIAPA